MDWEQYGVRTLDALTQSAIQFGNAYGQAWLSRDQAEAQIELAAKARALAPPAPPALSGTVVFLIVIGALIVASR